MLAEPDSPAAVGVRFDVVVHRHEGRGTMVLRPVELHPTGDPRSEQADQRWLDHALVVEKVVVVGLVPADMDPPSNLGEDHQVEVFVFQVDRLVTLVHHFVGDPVGERVRVYLAAAALIYPLLQEHRVRIRGRDRVGRDNHRLAPGSHGAVPLSRGRLFRRRFKFATHTLFSFLSGILQW